ncbi:hypothetical protein ACIQWB_04135 [Streptomyces olivaceus]
MEQYDGASVGLHASTVNSFGKYFETFEITHTLTVDHHCSSSLTS